jgi:hypothetical protein
LLAARALSEMNRSRSDGAGAGRRRVQLGKTRPAREAGGGDGIRTHDTSFSPV